MAKKLRAKTHLPFLRISHSYSRYRQSLSSVQVQREVSRGDVALVEGTRDHDR